MSRILSHIYTHMHKRDLLKRPTKEQNTLSHIHTHAHIYTCLRILYYNSLTSSKEFFTSSSKAARRRNKAQAFATNVISLQSKLVDQK
jgi:hypothetical protein